MTAPLDPHPAPTGALALDTFDLTKRFGSFTAMDRVTMTVAPGSVHCLLYTSPSPRDISGSRMPSSA